MDQCRKIRELNRGKGEGIDLKSVPGLLPALHKVIVVKAVAEKAKVTQICGSMIGKNVTDSVKLIEERLENKKQKQVKLLRNQDEKGSVLEMQR